MAIPRRVAKRPRAKPVSSVDRGAAVQQFRSQAGAIFVRRRKQSERHLDGAYLGFFNAKPITKLPTSFGVGSAGNKRRAEQSDCA
jgi:hypothetical protein